MQSLLYGMFSFSRKGWLMRTAFCSHHSSPYSPLSEISTYSVIIALNNYRYLANSRVFMQPYPLFLTLRPFDVHENKPIS
jgi:hypothetical protein